MYNEQCPICMGTFAQYYDVQLTPCNHAFHKECLMDHLKYVTEQALKIKVRYLQEKRVYIFEDHAPKCPLCQVSLYSALTQEEGEAIDQIDDLLASSVALSEANPDEINIQLED